MYTPQPEIGSQTDIGGAPWLSTTTEMHFPFEPTSKRRKGYPSETQVKRGQRVVGGDKYLIEKLGRNDPCPCNSGRRFQEVLYANQEVRGFSARRLLLGKWLLAHNQLGQDAHYVRVTWHSPRPCPRRYVSVEVSS